MSALSGRRLILYISRSEVGGWERPVFVAFGRYLRSVGAHIKFVRTDAFILPGVAEKTLPLPHSRAVLFDEHRGVFGVLDGADWARGWDTPYFDVVSNPACHIWLKAQFRRSEFTFGAMHKVCAWTYFECSPAFVQARLQTLRAEKKIPGPLYFRGNTSWKDRRAMLKSLVERGALSHIRGVVPMDIYLTELSRSEIALGLPGMGELCHREVECFAVGTPILRPRIYNELYDPLIPDQHYISVDVDAMNVHPDVVADAIISRYEAVRGDKAFLSMIRTQAMDWYERNVRMPNSLAMTARLMGLLGPVDGRPAF